MPLSRPSAREKLHTRTIVINGYRRADGLFDIEAELSDVKANGSWSPHRGAIAPDEPLHGMAMRMTVDEELRILGCEAASDYTPYAICPVAAPNFARLEGLQIKPGFLRDAAARIGGTAGCTHLRELLQQMGTTAHQTVHAARGQAEAEAARAATGAALSPEAIDKQTVAKFGGSGQIVNTCIAYDEAGPIVRQRWPHLYKSAEPG